MKSTGSAVGGIIEKYYLIIRGDIPSILRPNIAFRRAGSSHLRETRTINCPYCNKPLTEVGKDNKVELFRYPSRKKIRCQAYPVCQRNSGLFGGAYQARMAKRALNGGRKARAAWA